eukprot:g23151.t1
MEQLAPIGVFFLAQNICPKVFAGIVPEQILGFLPLVFTIATFIIMLWPQSEVFKISMLAQAPDFEIKDSSGSQTLKAYLAKNKRPTVIDFYQNFCPACGPAAGQIEELAGDEKYKGKVDFMLMNLGSLEDAEKRLGYAIPTWLLVVTIEGAKHGFKVLKVFEGMSAESRYAKERGLKGNAWHGHGSPHADYGLK